MSDSRTVSPTRKSSFALSTVSWLFLIYGLFGFVITIANYLGGNNTVQLELLGIPVFFGLRRHSPAWRVCALLLLGIWLFLILLAGGNHLFTNETAQQFQTTLNNVRFGWANDQPPLQGWSIYIRPLAEPIPFSIAFALVPAAAYACLLLWQGWLLTRRSTLDLFYRERKVW